MEDETSIAHLATCLPIKGALFCNDFDFISFDGKRDNLIALDQSQDLGIGLSLFITYKICLNSFPYQSPIDLFCLSLTNPLPCLLTLLPLFFHLDSEPFFIKTHSFLLKDIRCQVEGESKGVIKTEGHFS